MVGGAVGGEEMVGKAVRGAGGARCGVEWDCLGSLGLCLLCRGWWMTGLADGGSWSVLSVETRGLCRQEQELDAPRGEVAWCC